MNRNIEDLFITPGAGAGAAAARRARRLIPVSEQNLAERLEAESAKVRAWVRAHDFKGRAGTALTVPDFRAGAGAGAAAGGAPLSAFCGLPEGAGLWAGLWDWAAVFEALPPGDYVIDAKLSAKAAETAALAFALAAYRFSLKPPRAGAKPKKRLVRPRAGGHARVLSAARAVALVRDLITAPANKMDPAALADAARAEAKRTGAKISVITGGDLLKKGWPAVHAVGRAAASAPRLIDLRWGRAAHPKVTLIGKGVTFDSGGLDIKPAGAMKLMKKDMGGAAHVLGLAAMVMDAKLPVRLRVLIPAVENSVAGNAMRPLDVIETRAGVSVEIGNTDAEGRVILADALFEAARERPALMIDCATLTGAARAALGTELPALFCNDDASAEQLMTLGAALEDPLWRMPLWRPYARHVAAAKTGDVTNAPESGFGGAITAALFLECFVNAGAAKAKAPQKPARGRASPAPAHQARASCGAPGGTENAPPWVHLDLMAYNTSSRPGRPEGGEAMGLRALFALIEQRFGGKTPKP